MFLPYVGHYQAEKLLKGVHMTINVSSYNKLTYLLLTYLLTHSMVQGPSWEANRFSAS
jgi:hypothetical protein